MASGRPTIDWTWVVERLQDADQERALKAIRVHCALRQLDGVWPVPAEVVIEEGRRRLPPSTSSKKLRKPLWHHGAARQPTDTRSFR